MSAESAASSSSQPPTPTSKEVPAIVYKLIFLGSHHKASLFDKLCAAADKFEKHVQYPDLWYLNLTVDDIPCIIELTDPGMEHTGAREMSIRKAEAAILCYSSMSASSFHQLSSIAEDFKARKGFKYPPIKLICNEDDVVEEDFHETASFHTDQSLSEGYESGEDTSHPRTKSNGALKRRPSMEKIRDAHESTRITSDQGETMAKLFGPDCEFISMSVAEFKEARQLLEGLIRTINEKNHSKLKPLLKNRRKSKEAISSGAKVSPTNSIHSDSVSSEGSDTDKCGTGKNGRRMSNAQKLKKKVGNVSSHVCTIS